MQRQRKAQPADPAANDQNHTVLLRYGLRPSLDTPMISGAFRLLSRPSDDGA
jgi:hypothetical protein